MRRVLIADVAPGTHSVASRRVLRRACLLGAQGGGTLIAPVGPDGAVTIVGVRHLALDISVGATGTRREAEAAEAVLRQGVLMRDGLIHVMGCHLGLSAILSRGAGRVILEPGVTPAQRLRDERPEVPARRLETLVGVENKTARLVDALVVRTHIEAATWVKRGVAPEAVHVVHDSVGAVELSPMPQMPRIVLLGEGRIGRGLEAALTGIARVPGLWRLDVLTGEEAPVASLQRLARQMKVDQRVRFEPMGGDLAPRLTAGQCVVSGLSDGRRARSGSATPVAALWAAATGRPYVGPDLPLTRAVVGAGGLFVTPEDAGEIADAVGQVLEDSALRGELAAHSRARAARDVGGEADTVLATVWADLATRLAGV